MANRYEPSYADLVYQVLKSAGHPLTYQEIFDQVDRRRPVTTKNPKGTIRNVLSQGRQLVNTGDGRYGYLPQLVRGSLLRVPLTEKKPANHPLVFPDEVRHALWPSFLEIQKRIDRRPAHVQLPNGEVALLSLDFLGPSIWGSGVAEGLRRYLVDCRAAAGDSLLIRVVEGEDGCAEAWFESRYKRDDAAIGARNRELADAIEQLMRRRPEDGPFMWEIVVPLLGRGAYHSNVAPDPLEAILRADPRFEDTGLDRWMLAETVTPAMRAELRARKRVLDALIGSVGDAPSAIESAPPPRDRRVAMERTMADIGALLSEQEFESIDEANAFLQTVMAGGGVPRRMAETPMQRAQDLIYEARESTSSRERIRLARKALDLSTDCADAYVLLAEETARGPKEAADLYARGVAAGERALGEIAFKRDVGQFWGIVETRPYMRARLGLAMALWAMGRRREATEHLWEMLRLNPGDNQGIRYVLLNWLLERGDDDEAGRLLDLYPDDAAATWVYGRALRLFRVERDSSDARQALAEAARWNPHVPAYLLGKRRLPKQLPDLVGFGDEREAVACAAEQLEAWRKTPGALGWLGNHPS